MTEKDSKAELSLQNEMHFSPFCVGGINPQQTGHANTTSHIGKVGGSNGEVYLFITHQQFLTS